MFKASYFSGALETLRRLVAKSTPHLETVLVSLSQIAGLRPECFNQHREHIIIEIAVKKILMQPQPTASKSKSRSSKSSDDVGHFFPTSIKYYYCFNN